MEIEQASRMICAYVDEHKCGDLCRERCMEWKRYNVLSDKISKSLLAEKDREIERLKEENNNLRRGADEMWDELKKIQGS
jgi:hypothetical protein